MRQTTLLLTIFVLMAPAIATIYKGETENPSTQPPTKISYDIENIYKPIAKTKECLQREKTMQVIKLYNDLRNLTKNLYALTETDAKEFADLVSEYEEVRTPRILSCNRKLPRFAQCKFDEVIDILKNTKCDINEAPKATLSPTKTTKSPTTTSSTPTTKNKKTTLKKHRWSIKEQFVKKFHQKYFKKRNRRNDEEVENNESHHRERRQTLVENAVIRNSDGSLTMIRKCHERGSQTENGHRRLMRECAVTTILPETRFPRYINEVLCDYTSSTCLSNEGTSIQLSSGLTFKRDNRGLGLGRIGDWDNYNQPIREACICQLFDNSFIRYFL